VITPMNGSRGLVGSKMTFTRKQDEDSSADVRLAPHADAQLQPATVDIGQVQVRFIPIDQIAP